MTANETIFLVLVLCVFLLFGGVLGWASWMRSCTQRESANDTRDNRPFSIKMRQFWLKEENILGTLAAFLAFATLYTPIPVTLTCIIRSSVRWE